MAAPNRRFASERHPLVKIAAAVVALATFASIWTVFSSAYASDSAANTTAQPPAGVNITPAAGAATSSASPGAGSAPPLAVTPSPGSQGNGPLAPVQRRSRGS